MAKDLGLNYATFAALLFAIFVTFSCVILPFLYGFDKCKNRGIILTMSMQESLEKDYKYALNCVGKQSVYSYFVTDSRFGWLVAFTTLLIQIISLIFFVKVTEPHLQDDSTQLQFIWICPRDSDMCRSRADIVTLGWVIFGILVTANLAKDLIGGFKLICYSSKFRHSLGSRIRYFIAGVSLVSITLFALYVSICNDI